ncbi:hypothetical protein BC829DRAFT_440972 [Chytridium lagenaria]|nr:hypothetical protein BC829DRAFT_440972 [Chytridium lagenaria]
MFVFLSKKIAIPNGVKLRTVAWNNDQGWIACGGEEGLLKVLKLEPSPAVISPGAPADGPNGSRRPGENLAVSSNLSMNQTLEGHSGAVVVSKWNEQHRKLTTSDQHGLIIVWILYKGIWYEEMINNRNKSVVADMQWSKDGQKICIVYEDGAVIVGSVDGNRLWGKELKQTQLAQVQWSPDGKFILFGTASGELQLYDNSGNFLNKVPTFGNDNSSPIKIAAIDWYNGCYGYLESRVPCLALAFENGKIQIMRDDKDTAPLIIDSNMKYLKLKWNTNGSILAVSGVQFARSSQGEEKEVSVVQFYDPFGQYLRSLKVPGKRISSLSWEHGGLRIALAVDSFIYFANIRPDYKWAFFAEDVLVYGHNRFDRPETALVFWNTKTNERHTNFTLTISNAIGTAIETKYIDFAPKYAVLTKQFAIVASGEIVLCWQFKALAKKYNILDKTGIHEGGSTTDLRKKRSNDPIAAITSSETTLAIARQSGLITFITLPNLTVESKYSTPILKCASASKGSDFTEAGKFLEFDRKDVWDVKWSNDNPELFAIMEKTRMYVFRNVDPEEPLTCSGCCALGRNFKEPESPSKEHMLLIDSKTLRDTRNILSQVGLADGLQFVEDNPHPRLWRLIADAALEALNFSVAQKAYIRCADYAGLQFIKRLLKLEDPQKQKAEISAHFSQYDVAERLYLEMDRKDLAMDLRVRLGDWFRVVQLIKSGGSGDDVLLEKASQAITYYSQGRNTERLVECFYIVEDYDSLEKIMFTIPDSSPLLPNIARKFVSVGLCDQAVTSFLKTGDIKAPSTPLAEEASKAGKNPLKLKKLYVLAALEVERYHQLNKVQRVGAANISSEGLLAEDRKNNDDTKFLDNVWRGAEAYHYYLLAQRQFYAGNASAAMKTASHLVNYDDILDPKVTNALLALLETLPKSTEAEKETFENLALNIFTKYPPQDPKPLEITCTNCASIINDGGLVMRYV